MSNFVDKHNLKSIQLDVGDGSGGELTAACEHIVRELVDGVRHGFYKMTIVVEKISSTRTSITVEAGKSNRFVV